MSTIRRNDTKTGFYAQVTPIDDESHCVAAASYGRHDAVIDFIDFENLGSAKMFHHVLGEWIKREDSKDEG